MADMKTLLENYEEGPYKDFGLTFDEYCHAYGREGLDECDCKGCSKWSHVSKTNLMALYFDGDEGAALFSAINDNFEEAGFSMRLLHCTYCDIRFDTMATILETLEYLHDLPSEEPPPVCEYLELVR